MKFIQTAASVKVNRLVLTGTVLACIVIMLGCAGVSTSKSNSQIVAGTLSLGTASVDFGSVTTGSSKTVTVNATNTGSASVTVSSASFSSQSFTLATPTLPMALLAGQTTPVSLVFSPKTAGAFNGTLSITSNASDSAVTVPLTGTGVTAGGLSPSPVSLSFGTVQTGTSQALAETLTNNGGSSVTISQIGISGTGFTLSGITAPVTLAAGQSANFTVTYAPTSTAAASGSVTVTSNGSDPTLAIALSGTGSTTAGTLNVTPSPIAVGSVFLGTTGSGTGTLTAIGTNVTITGATSSNSRFVLSGVPTIIPAGQSLSFTVTYSPLVAGADSTNLTFTSNAQAATTSDTSTGTGVTPPAHNVVLTWNASSSSNISTYNIYRAAYGSSCGGFSKIASTAYTVTTYTDSAVTDGTNYCYATTAVDSSNAESGYSNIVSNVQIPAP
ncbi:MAG TPA: choice-of-anchor D domain-containing protein [Candidatus Sulfotelmatobacter sp.]|nr:choice-of-anchor D domain-containing protein [Candidatus Sulfotelmatobacter sp.]